MKLRSGLVACTEESGVLLCEKTMKCLRLRRGDFVQISSDEHGTQIVRELKGVQTASTVLPNYIYMDQESLSLLSVQLNEPLQVHPSEVSLACP